MPRKAKEEVEEAPITDKIGDTVSTVADKVGDAVSTVGDVASEPASAVAEAVGGTMSAVGEKVSGAVAAVTNRGEDEDAADEETEALPENEALPEVITLKGEAAPAITLPEYLKGRRIEMGRVVSDKMQKTVVVLVERSKTHPIYKKVMRRSIRFMAHDEIGAGMGDTVRIIEARPMSRHKRWQVVEIVQKAERL
jgi:small subunit ribosomal protein S17